MAEPQLPESACAGVVRRIDGDLVYVELDASGHCSVCASKSHCAFAPDTGRLLEARAHGFQVGNRVLVHMEQRTALRASLILYLVPTILVLVGSFAGYSAGEIYRRGGGNLGSLLGVVAGLIAGYAFVHFFGRIKTGQPFRLEKLD